MECYTFPPNTLIFSLQRYKTQHLSPHLDKGYFTLAHIAVNVFDGHLPVVFDPALATEDVMDAGSHFVPLVVVPETGGNTTHTHTHTPLLFGQNGIR